jgi:CRISPR/Cas system-associated protein Cas10 (large subunit of type III CRISPR-Cas system)
MATVPHNWPRPTEQARVRPCWLPAERSCEWCGNRFLILRSCNLGRQRYCSESHRQAAKDARRRPYKAEHARLWRIRETARRQTERTISGVVQR